MNFTDYYLLAIFAAVMEEKNYTRVAKRLGITQPSVSNNVARLREIYDDPLFIREKLGVRPTAFAEELYPDISKALLYIDSVSAKNTRFDPQRSKRSFKLSVIGVFEHTLVPELFRLVEREAPETTIIIDNFKAKDTKDMLLKGALDLSIEPMTRIGSSLQYKAIYQDELVVVCREGNPFFPKNSIEQCEFLEHKHIRLSNLADTHQFFNNFSATISKQLNSRITRKYVASHWGLLSAVMDGNELGVFARKMVVEYANLFKLRILENDFLSHNNIEAGMYWAKARSNDPSIKWLRNKVSQAAINVFDQVLK